MPPQLRARVLELAPGIIENVNNPDLRVPQRNVRYRRYVPSQQTDQDTIARFLTAVYPDADMSADTLSVKTGPAAAAAAAASASSADPVTTAVTTVVQALMFAVKDRDTSAVRHMLPGNAYWLPLYRASNGDVVILHSSMDGNHLYAAATGGGAVAVKQFQLALADTADLIQRFLTMRDGGGGTDGDHNEDHDSGDALTTLMSSAFHAPLDIYTVTCRGDLATLTPTEMQISRRCTFDRLVSDTIDEFRGTVERFKRGRLYADANDCFMNNLYVLLHGRRGTGKTSTVRAVCNALDRSAVTVSMSKIKTATQLRAVLRHSKTTVLVLDEFDCMESVLTSRSTASDARRRDDADTADRRNSERIKELLALLADCNNGGGGGNKDAETSRRLRAELDNLMSARDDAVTLETFLTELDGVSQSEGRCVMFCTNRPLLLDRALLRPGRIHYSIELRLCSRGELARLVAQTMRLPATDAVTEHPRWRDVRDHVWAAADVNGLIVRFGRGRLDDVIAALAERTEPDVEL